MAEIPQSFICSIDQNLSAEGVELLKETLRQMTGVVEVTPIWFRKFREIDPDAARIRQEILPNPHVQQSVLADAVVAIARRACRDRPACGGDRKGHAGSLSRPYRCGPCPLHDVDAVADALYVADTEEE